MEILDEESIMKIHGYERDSEIIIPSPGCIRTCQEIASIDRMRNLPSIEMSNGKKERKQAKQFMQTYFRLHKVLYKNTLGNKISYAAALYIPNIKTAAKVSSRSGIYINPFWLPISYTSESMSNGALVENGLLVDDEEFNKNNHVSYQGIILPRNPSELTEATYVHEITHTQLNDQPGIVKKYNDSEIISIFLELVDTLESNGERLLRIEDVIRTNELLIGILSLHKNSQEQNMERNELLEMSKYVNSISKAYSLFIEYYYGTPSLKKYILRCIQNMFDGNLALEEVLEEFEISFTSSIEDPRLLKYLRR